MPRFTVKEIRYWFVILLSATLPALPWPLHGFNLRTLQIATTLVAMVLGLVVSVNGQ